MSKNMKIFLTVAVIALVVWYFVRSKSKEQNAAGNSNSGSAGSSGNNSTATERDGGYGNNNDDPDQYSPGASTSQPSYNPDEEDPDLNEEQYWKDPRWETEDPTQQNSNGESSQRNSSLDRKEGFSKFNPIDLH